MQTNLEALSIAINHHSNQTNFLCFHQLNQRLRDETLTTAFDRHVQLLKDIQSSCTTPLLTSLVDKFHHQFQAKRDVLTLKMQRMAISALNLPLIGQIHPLQSEKTLKQLLNDPSILKKTFAFMVEYAAFETASNLFDHIYECSLEDVESFYSALKELQLEPDAEQTYIAKSLEKFKPFILNLFETLSTFIAPEDFEQLEDTHKFLNRDSYDFYIDLFEDINLAKDELRIFLHQIYTQQPELLNELLYEENLPRGFKNLRILLETPSEEYKMDESVNDDLIATFDHTTQNLAQAYNNSIEKLNSINQIHSESMNMFYQTTLKELAEKILIQNENAEAWEVLNQAKQLVSGCGLPKVEVIPYLEAALEIFEDRLTDSETLSYANQIMDFKDFITNYGSRKRKLVDIPFTPQKLAKK